MLVSLTTSTSVWEHWCRQGWLASKHFSIWLDIRTRDPRTGKCCYRQSNPRFMYQLSMSTEERKTLQPLHLSPIGPLGQLRLKIRDTGCFSKRDETSWILYHSTVKHSLLEAYRLYKNTVMSRGIRISSHRTAETSLQLLRAASDYMKRKYRKDSQLISGACATSCFWNYVISFRPHS
jgi:hypothetical protein